ncbi:N-acetylmuramoyl-L-alanine amidase family protein [Crassaminicella profunda]|uniref:N-acetylmuramoyl-L-alanine amidase family protein n=1 Tax=Crassaminicella profunda TaxID=1286698 RepID=UPI001CA7988F|nr:N-acetylmuramoyl-L-alanine amidase family protein [Crassaminicella profunda]QZY54060.1 N-acetylmuramoyl-L-alanine amidase family protein [Crassaminicella profunda]
MKRLVSIFLIFTIVLGMSTISFGAKLEQSFINMTDEMTGKTQQVRRVNVMMGGKDVYTDVPPVLYTVNNKSKILVPIRLVEEHLGAKIQWNQEKYEATMIVKDKVITLKIDSNVARVNGKGVNLPDGVPAKLLSYEGNTNTMVPLKFIGEQFGMEVNWIPEIVTATVDYPEQTINGITYENNGPTPQILIKTTGQVDFNTMYLPGSRFGGNDRLIIDIPNTKLNINNPNLTKNGGIINKNVNVDGVIGIRGSIFETNPRNVSRIVIDLSMKKEYQVVFNEELCAIQVKFSKGENSQAEDLNAVKNIGLEKRNNLDAIVIQTEEEPQYNVMDFGNKVVVDVLNAKLAFNQNEIPIAQGSIKRIRTAQFAPDDNYDKNEKIVRVVLDLEEGQSLENIFVDHEGTDILIYTNKEPLDQSYNQKFDYLDYQREDMNGSFLKLTLKELGEYAIDYATITNELIIKVPKNKIELKEEILDIEDNMIKSIRVSGNDDDYYIGVQLKDITDYRIQTTEKFTDRIIIKFENRRIKTSNYSGKLVIIDPGHGGKDPGASNKALNLVEKELTLDTAKRLNDLLKKSGFTTYMTRTDDTTLNLYGRPEVANGLGGAAFVSIHYNYAENKGVSGIEMLYVDDPTRDCKRFAKTIQEEMIKELKVKDRGIKNEPEFVVIRETNMPSVIAEVGFISNQREGMLISTPEYRQKAAQALFNGIKRYFDEE